MINEAYFIRSASGDVDELFETLDDAIAYGQTEKLAPFTVMQLLPYPVRSVLTNGRNDFGRPVERK